MYMDAFFMNQLCSQPITFITLRIQYALFYVGYYQTAYHSMHKEIAYEQVPITQLLSTMNNVSHQWAVGWLLSCVITSRV